MKGPLSFLTIKIARMGYSPRQRIRFYRKLATLMKNGKQLQVSVENLRKRAARKGATEVEAVALGDIFKEMRTGLNFATAMRNYISVNERMILESGEKSGDLPNALELAAEILEASGQMKLKVIGAVAAPLFLLAMLLGVMVLLAKVVMPKLTAVLEPSQWDSAAQMLYRLTQIIDSYWMVVFLVIFLAIIAVTGLSLSRWSGRGRTWADRIPPWSLFRLLIGSGWIMSLASLIKSGETVLGSLQKMQRVSRKNKWLHDRLGRTIFYYNTGLNLGEALEATKTDFPDGEIVDDLVIYSDMEGFDEILYSIGKEWTQTGLEKIRQQAALLNTGAIMLIGLVLGWFTYAVVSIQMSMGSHFTGM